MNKNNFVNSIYQFSDFRIWKFHGAPMISLNKVLGAAIDDKEVKSEDNDFLEIMINNSTTIEVLVHPIFELSLEPQLIIGQRLEKNTDYDGELI